MKKTVISVRLAPGAVESIERVQRVCKLNRTQAVELIADIVDSNFNDVMIQRHYDMIYKFARVDGRRTKK